MKVSVSAWMFAPIATLAPEQWQQWYEHVYVASDVDLLLCDPVRSMVIATYPGCGITTSLAMLRSTDLLIFAYNPEQWPGQAQAFTAGETHFDQWMAHVAYALTEKLREHHEYSAKLHVYQHQFLVWLLQRYVGRRQHVMWQGYLQSVLPSNDWANLQHVMTHEPIQYEQSISDLKYQLHECIEIAQLLGWRGIFASIDINWWDWLGRSGEERDRFDAQLRQLLTTLAPLEVPHFGVKLGIPTRLLPPQEIDRLTRSRIKPTIYPMTYQWSRAQLHAVSTRLLALAAHESGVTPIPLPEELWDLLAHDLASMWEKPGPSAAVMLAQQWFSHAIEHLTDEALLQVFKAELYQRAAPLRLDRNPGSQTVWRGETPIVLDDTPFRIFQIVWQHRGNPVSNETLLNVAGTKANLDKIISRLREQLEPFYKAGLFIYLQRKQGSGTWFEKNACLFS